MDVWKTRSVTSFTKEKRCCEGKSVISTINSPPIYPKVTHFKRHRITLSEQFAWGQFKNLHEYLTYLPANSKSWKFELKTLIKWKGLCMRMLIIRPVNQQLRYYNSTIVRVSKIQHMQVSKYNFIKWLE